MRARYSAFAEGQLAFIRDSLSAAARETHDAESIRRWSLESQWLGLDVLSVEGGGPADDSGIVEFVARYRAEGRIMAHRERAKFEREDGKWVFADSDEPKPSTFRRDEPKVHRNDPCPCGSGKKHKKCCGT